MSPSLHPHKAEGYAFSLNLVRSLDLWSGSSTFPSNVTKPHYLPLSPSGAVDWSELIRKYLKHNPGQAPQLIAATTRLELAVWQAVERQPPARIRRGSSSQYKSSRWRSKSLQGQQNGTLDRPTRPADGDTIGSSAAGHVASKKTSGQDEEDALGTTAAAAAAATARALPAPPGEWMIRDEQARARIRDMSNTLQQHLAPSGPSSSSSTAAASAKAIQLQSANTVLALARFAVGAVQHAHSTLTRDGTADVAFASQTDSDSHDLDLQVLAIVLHGMTLEHLARDRIEAAIAAYSKLPVSPPPPIPEGRRFALIGLYRLAMLEGKSSSFSAHRNFLSLSADFTRASPHLRVQVYSSYLRNILESLLTSTSDPSDGRTTPAANNENDPDPSEIFATFQAYEALLQNDDRVASFPRAGDPTPEMYEFMHLLYSFWTYGLLPGPYTVDALYRALNKTYASQMLHRFLVLVLTSMSYQSTDRGKGREYAEDALRNLRLYIALFEKSRETDEAAVQREIRAFRTRTEGVEASAHDSAKSQSDEAAGEEEVHASPIESEEDFAKICCTGTRLLLRESGMDGKQEQGDERIDLVQEAMTTIERAYKRIILKKKEQQQQQQQPQQQSNEQADTKDQHRQRDHSSIVDSLTKAEVLLWYGVTKTEYALAEADPEQGRQKAKQGLEALASALAMLPESSASRTVASMRTKVLYSLAYAQLELRDLSSALSTSKRLVDGLQASSSQIANADIIDLRTWHLFVLALTARKDWSKAKEVAELALFGDENRREAEYGPMRGPEFRDGQAQTLSTSSSAPPLSSTGPLQSPILDEISVNQNPLPHITTPADAPFDPATNNTPARTQTVEKISTSTDSSSSYVHVHKTPEGGDVPGGSVAGDAGAGPRAGGVGSSSPSTRLGAESSTMSRSPSIMSFTQKRYPHTHKPTSAWDDLEHEMSLWLTRNKCIEAVDGPELALQDLQQNVFTHFSRRREEIEAEEQSRKGDIPSAKVEGDTTNSSYPYPSKEAQNKPSLYDKLEDQNRSPSATHTPGRARSILGSISLRHRSRTVTSQQSVGGAPGGQEGYLGVPSDGHRPASVRSNVTNDSVPDNSLPQTLPTTQANSAQGSFEQAAAAPPPPPSTSYPAAGGVSATRLSNRLQHPQAAKILSKLWLTSAASFRRWGRMDECRGAINEAEEVAGEVDPDVWVQYALYLLTSKKPEDVERALLSLTKAVAIQTDHLPTIVIMAKIHLDKGNVAITEGFLDVATQMNAWDSPEAWYLLAKVYEQTRRSERARECLVYALGLEETRPIRDLRGTLTRYL